MDEHAYIRSIHRRMNKRVHRWKINARFADGVPDAWYSAQGGDLWVEYKYLHRAPVRHFNPTRLLSALQRHWLNARLQEGRNVAVIVGCDEGGLVLKHGAWNDVVRAPFNWLDAKEITRWIEAQVLSTSTPEVAATG